VAESLVNQYVSAYETKNADLYLSLFSEDGVYVDYGINLEPTPLVYLREDVYSTFADTHFQFEITSYFVSADGRFAAIEGIYTDWPRGANQTASVPCLAILEIRDGRIVKESFYYNGAEF
jgi:ketosteroid isomerase-like protein